MSKESLFTTYFISCDVAVLILHLFGFLLKISHYSFFENHSIVVIIRNMEKYILAIDQGTTSSRAIIFDKEGKKVASANREVKCLYPQEGYVEEDPTEIWISVVDVINEVLIKSNISWNQINSIGITNQRETTIVWDKASGNPIYHAIVWQSRQSVEICEKLSDKKEFIHERTGLLINPYFSASKIRYILDHVKNGQQRAEKESFYLGQLIHGSSIR